MPEPLSTLSPAKQNSRISPAKHDFALLADRLKSPTSVSPAPCTPPSLDTSTPLHLTERAHSPPLTAGRPSSPRKAVSPIKYRLQDEQDEPNMATSPPGSPAESTMRFNEGLTRAIDTLQNEGHTQTPPHLAAQANDYTQQGEFADPPYEDDEDAFDITKDYGDEMTLTLSLDDSKVPDDTVGDLSTISAIPTDMTRFANLRNSPTKQLRQDWSPSKQLRGAVTATPGTQPRPLQLLSRRSTSSNEDDDATPRKPYSTNDTTDLMNFTGQTNIVIPPPSAPRTARRSPSGRGAFPIKINPSPSHRSQASVDRERASGRSPQKMFPDRHVPATPANHRHSMHVSPSGTGNGLGNDLLDIDFGPMATPRSIPTVTPRELETLRSELQSRISGLEATLSGKEAEVMALKRSITDAEVRVGKTSEELRTERSAREEAEHQKEELERRSREMEEVLREIKQSAFLEEREKEKLRRQAEEAERKVEEHEVKVLELQASLSTLRSDRIKSSPSPQKVPATPGNNPDIDFAVKDATEKVARELHALYKGKHERKVSDLKVSYEKRWAKQVEQLRADLKASQEEVLKLQTEREATMSGIVPGQSEAMSRMEGQIEELRRWNEESAAEKKMIEAEAAGLRGQVDSLTGETASLRKEIEQERVEKGELVAQVDLFLSMSAQQEEPRPQSQPVSPPRSEDGGRPNSAAAYSSPNKFRTSGSGAPPGPSGRPRPMSMLQKPTAGKFSGIPAPGSSGLKAPKANGYGVGRSGGIMEGIARMGAGGR